MPDGLTIARDLAAKRERVVRGMSPMAKHQRFPQVYARPQPKPELIEELRAEIARLSGDNGRLREENTLLKARVAALEAEADARRNAMPVAEVKAPSVPIEAVMVAFCEEFNRRGGMVDGAPLSLNSLKTTRRPRSLAHPRQTAIWLCREITTASYPQIGRRFGGRDHTTCMHACQNVQYVFAMRPDLKEAAEAVLARFAPPADEATP